MRNKVYLFLFIALVYGLVVGGTGYAIGAGDCPDTVKATVSDEMLTRLARFCLSACTACPDPCPQVICPDCPEPPKCKQLPDIIIEPTLGPKYRIEGLLTASKDSYGLGALWRPHTARSRFGGVGVLWQRIDGSRASYGAVYGEDCSGLGNDPYCTSWAVPRYSTSTPDYNSYSVVATFGLW